MPKRHESGQKKDNTAKTRRARRVRCMRHVRCMRRVRCVRHVRRVRGPARVHFRGFVGGGWPERTQSISPIVPSLGKFVQGFGVFFCIAPGGIAKHPRVLTTELRRTFIPYMIRGLSGAFLFRRYEAPGFDQAKLLLELHGRQRGYLFKPLVKAGNTHLRNSRQLVYS